jgi:FkbM family methyltransferase
VSLITNPVILLLRKLSRKLGVNRVLGGLIAKSGYEARLAVALQDSIREGDCVWDVGANVGWYTVQFAQWVGSRGRVIAFEPGPDVVGQLHEAVRAYPNVSVCALGLSNLDRAAPYDLGNQRNTTGMITNNASAESTLATVMLARGDSLLKSGQADLPCLVKIDVEGHELEVLEGMTSILEHPRLRHLFIEIHFTVLEKQGRATVPSIIEALLRAKRFDVRWVDPSHLHALR